MSGAGPVNSSPWPYQFCRDCLPLLRPCEMLHWVTLSPLLGQAGGCFLGRRGVTESKEMCDITWFCSTLFPSLSPNAGDSG